MKTIRVDLKVQSERELKVVWNGEYPWPPYFIYRPAIEDCAGEIRRTLSELVEAALESHLGSTGPTLKKLAEQGSRLHKALFTKTSGEGDPEQIRLFYENSTEPFRLRFFSDLIFVPWGLVYSADPTQLPLALAADPLQAWEAYRNFWCLSRDLSTVYDRILPDALGRGQEDPATMEMVRVVHPSTFSEAGDAVAAGPEAGFLSWLKNRFGEPISSKRALSAAWLDKKLRIKLLYFYCHASATRLALGEDEEIKASDLFLLLSDGPQRPPGSSSCLLLINGCSTAVGSTSGDFLSAVGQRGLCGFVGTETDVPDIFALRFSLGLLHHLFQKGMTLGDAMQRMHRDHFPLSLVYGLYAVPDFRMPQTGAPDVAATAPGNFSFARVGTHRLEGRHGC